MPKRLPDRLRPDSVGEFRRSARARFAEGEALVAAGHRLGAVHLWGYAAEMTLKAAYFGVIGFADRQPITFSDLNAAKGVAVVLLGAAWTGNLHNLELWARLLTTRRASNPSTA